MARYKMLCDCGAPVHFDHDGPKHEKAVALSRVICDACGHVNYGVLKGPSAYEPRESTVALWASILDVFDEVGPPMTVRQVYYRLTTFGAVPKDDAGYNKVQRQLTNMRRDGSIPYHWLSDNTRRYIHVDQYNGIGDALDQMHRYYRRDLWHSQPEHVEIWLEKRALEGQLAPICNEFGVRLYPCGGYSSISFAYEAGEELRQIQKPIVIYHLSDFDADGVYSSVCLEKELRLHGARFTFRRLALTQEQIDTWGLHGATRPQKRSSTRYRWWKDTYGASARACELDAIDPRDLRQLVHTAITQHIDPYEWQNLQKIESQERNTLQTLRSMVGYMDAT